MRQRLEEIIQITVDTSNSVGWKVSVISKDTRKWQHAIVQFERGFQEQTPILVRISIEDSYVEITPDQLSGLLNFSFWTTLGLVQQNVENLDWVKKKESTTGILPSKIKILTSLLERFPKAARQLQRRYNSREPLVIEDEYDLQDVLHSFLHLHFDDIRREDPSPDRAGASSRIDFILKNEKIGIEVKMANARLKNKKIGEQLSVDIQRYQAHPDCDMLLCFIYDPQGFIRNPSGFENDLTGKSNDLDIYVIVAPH